MSKYVLVLNKSWFAINIISWEKALSELFQDSVKALDRDLNTYTFSEWMTFSTKTKNYPRIKTVNREIAIPEILILNNYNKIPKIKYSFSKSRVFERDKFTCCFCNNIFSKTELTVDHLIPKSRGGNTTWTNIITACKKCNWEKGNKTIKEIGMKMHFIPKEPKWISPIYNLKAKSKLPSWDSFLYV